MGKVTKILAGIKNDPKAGKWYNAKGERISHEEWVAMIAGTITVHHGHQREHRVAVAMAERCPHGGQGLGRI